MIRGGTGFTGVSPYVLYYISTSQRFSGLSSTRHKSNFLVAMTRAVRSTSENGARTDPIDIAASDDGMLLRSRIPHHHERASPIRPCDHSATLMPVTANNFSHFHFKFVDFVVEIISSAIESIILSFRIIFGPISMIFTLHPTDRDNDDHHRGFGRHKLVDYFRLDTHFDHFIAPMARPVAKRADGVRPPAMTAGPLVASRLAFPVGRDQLRRPCDPPREERRRRAVRRVCQGGCVP
jgi:hypothetical protein